MKKLVSLSLCTATLFSLSLCASSFSVESAVKEDINKVCSVKTNGIKKVLETAKSYNAVAIKKGVEFRRLGVNNSDLIISVEDAIKTGKKEVNPKDFKGKKSKTKLETNYAAERACKFAIAALVQSHEGKSTWRLAVPGDGYKY